MRATSHGIKEQEGKNAHAKYGKLNENEIKVNQSKTKINYKNQSKTQMNCTGSICDLLWSLIYFRRGVKGMV